MIGMWKTFTIYIGHTSAYQVGRIRDSRRPNYCGNVEWACEQFATAAEADRHAAMLNEYMRAKL